MPSLLSTNDEPKAILLVDSDDLSKTSEIQVLTNMLALRRGYPAGTFELWSGSVGDMQQRLRAAVAVQLVIALWHRLFSFSSRLDPSHETVAGGGWSTDAHRMFG